MQIVSQLELQLQKERERLQAMMAHLHLAKEADLRNGGQQQNKGVMEHRSSPLAANNERPKVRSFVIGKLCCHLLKANSGSLEKRLFGRQRVPPPLHG